MFSTSSIVGTRTKLLRRSSAATRAGAGTATATTTMVVAAACKQSTTFIKRLLLRIHSMVIPRVLFFTCCCSCYTTYCSSAMQPPTFSLINAITATRRIDKSSSSSSPRRLAFCGSLSFRRRNYDSDSNSLLSPSFFGTTTRTTNPPMISQASNTKRFFSSSDNNGNDNINAGGMSVELLADQLVNSKYSKIIALVGAGASCSAGIPDFRTPGTGLYDQLSGYNLPFPEAIFELDYYKKNPMPFVDLCKAIWPGQESGPKPTLSHTFLKLLEEKNCLHRIYTQNIDGLEALAGVSTEKLVECHGHFRSSSCVACNKPMRFEECRKTIVDEGIAPMCHDCGSLVKPDIVFFGEEMPSRFQELIDKDMEECDLLLILGTSLMVMPVAGIPSWVSSNCPRILLNRELVGDITTSTGIFGEVGKNTKDLFLKGDCDDSVRNLCDLTGWTDEIENLPASK